MIWKTSQLMKIRMNWLPMNIWKTLGSPKKDVQKCTKPVQRSYQPQVDFLPVRSKILQQLDNGLAEITVVMPMSRWKLPLRLGRLYLGNHLGADYIYHRRGHSIEVEPGSDCRWFEMDGEIRPAGPNRIEILPAALWLLA